MWNSLEEVAASVRSCVDCPLHRGRLNAVPGAGDPEARIMFIGEGPGYHEDAQGLPFVGAAGNLLNELLGEIGLRREQVFVANVIKCRAPQNRDPLPEEIEACSKYLDRQIELLDPEVIVTLGRFSMGRFMPGERISRVHGSARKVDGRTVLAVYHPAAALHQPSLRQTLSEDFKRIVAALEAAAPAPEPAPQQSARQLNLF